MKISRTRQAVTGLIIVSVIAATLLCGVVLALAENGAGVSQRPTPTIFRIPTLAISDLATPQVTPALGTTVVLIPTSLPTSTSTLIPTQTIPPSFTPQILASTLRGCQMPPGWQVYRVQSGDTLFLIGLQYGLTVTTIMDSNCLDTTTIAAGQMLYVPPVTPRPLPVNSAGARQPTFPMLTGTHTATDGACTDVDSTIRFPNVGAMLNGLVRIVGTARALNFAYYELEIRQEGSEQAYANLYTSHDPVTDGELGQWDTSLFPNGEYWLRLTVINNDNAYLEPCAILVAVINLT